MPFDLTIVVHFGHRVCISQIVSPDATNSQEVLAQCKPILAGPTEVDYK